MGYKLNLENMNLALNKLKKTYKIYAPKVFEGAGTFSDTDRVRYGEVSTIEEIEFNEKSSYSYKETMLFNNYFLMFIISSTNILTTLYYTKSNSLFVTRIQISDINSIYTLSFAF